MSGLVPEDLKPSDYKKSGETAETLIVTGQRIAVARQSDRHRIDRRALTASPDNAKKVAYLVPFCV